MAINRDVRIGLAGIGGYGEAYLDALLHDPRAAGGRLIGVVETMPHRCRRLDELAARGIPVHPTVDALFATSRVDLLMIASPIHAHARQTCYALQHGANVLCEKPLAGSLADAVRMAECERASRQFAAIGYQWSFSDAVQALKRDIMAGALGRPIRMKTLVFFPRAVSYFRRNNWAGRVRTAEGEPVLDSPANNAAAHYLHNMLYLLGRTRESSTVPQSVQAELYRANEIENYDTVALRAMTSCGSEVLFYASHAVPGRRGPVCHFEFERGTVTYDADGDSTFTATFLDGRVRSYGDPNVDRNNKIWQSIEAVDTGARPVCGIPAALAHTACVLAAQQSVKAIIEFPQRMRKLTRREDGESIVCVVGLAECLTACFAEGLLPAEMDRFAWSEPSARIELPALHRFGHRAAGAHAGAATHA